jgi:predicted nucleotidyltransferase
VSIASFLQRVTRILHEADVSYMLTGSLAAAYYATPRSTQDVDAVIDTEEEGIERLVQGLLDAGLYVDRDAALSAWRTRTQFNAIDAESGWKVDLIVRKDRPFNRAEFERRDRAELLGVEVSLVSLEDIVIAKLEWARMGDSGMQRDDVARLLERNRDRLDRAYVEKWIADLGLEAEWTSVSGRLEE